MVDSQQHEPTDAELLRRFVDGDEEAFVQLVVRHFDAVERWVRHQIGARPEVDDVVQETFLAAIGAAESFRGADSARAWLFGIARHRIARQFRRRVDEPETYEPLEELGLRAGWGDPEAHTSRVESAEIVRDAFERLKSSEREVLVLRDIEGFTNPEAAEILGLEVNAVKSRLHRARLALMAELQQEMGDG